MHASISRDEVFEALGKILLAEGKSFEKVDCIVDVVGSTGTNPIVTDLEDVEQIERELKYSIIFGKMVCLDNFAHVAGLFIMLVGVSCFCCLQWCDTRNSKKNCLAQV